MYIHEHNSRKQVSFLVMIKECGIGPDESKINFVVQSLASQRFGQYRRGFFPKNRKVIEKENREIGKECGRSVIQIH
jgi:regulatory protein YycH of two-component signal transduction system YycFG